jgi:hypothetical protein
MREDKTEDFVIVAIRSDGVVVTRDDLGVPESYEIAAAECEMMNGFPWRVGERRGEDYWSHFFVGMRSRGETRLLTWDIEI